MTHGERLAGLGILALAVLLGLLGLGWAILGGGSAAGEAAEAAAAPDLLLLAAPGGGERPPAVFRHAAHDTLAVSQVRERGCEACHRREADGTLSFAFLDLADSLTATFSAAGRREAWHGACLDCHERSGAPESVGAAACGGCHREEPPARPLRADIRFDYGLHHRHVEGVASRQPELKRRCAICHHVWDPDAGRLVYREKDAEACDVCHRPAGAPPPLLPVAAPPGGVSSLAAASHRACVNCHLAIAPDQARGPVTCAGCHDPARQPRPAAADTLPRMPAGQPDVLFVHAETEDLAASQMRVVPFDHAGHERATTSCRTCHHEGMARCSDCHELQEEEAADGSPAAAPTAVAAADTAGDAALDAAVRARGVPPLALAMHDPRSRHSCVGCHEERKARPECAGCHRLRPAAAMMEAFCAECHAGPPPAQLARLAPEDRPRPEPPTGARLAPSRFPPDAVPDSLTIGGLADRYEPARMPHRRILDVLGRDIEASRLAVAFHGTADRLCQGCHHHSPEGELPPHCGHCHGEPFQAENLQAPGLYGAYHRQCLGCHEAMGKPTGCTECHAERPELARGARGADDAP